MASKKTKKTAPERKGKVKVKAKNKAETGKRKGEPPVKMIIRRNAAPKRARAPSDDQEERERKALTERMDEMGGSHVAAGVGAGAIGNVLGVIAVGKGWVSPKWTAGLLMGSGAATMAAGWYWEWDHVMAVGAGMTTAGAFSITNQLAVDAYEAMETKAAEKRKKREEEEAEKERLKRLADARELLEAEAEKKKTRNARRIVILDGNGEPLDADFEEYDAA